MSKAHTHAYGGQAVLEGVMMRGRRSWAIAVRQPDGDIYLERHAVSEFPERNPLWKKPMFRGVWGLVDAMTIGTKALTISANASGEEEEEISGSELVITLLVSLGLFIGVFIVLPNAGLAPVAERLGGGDSVWFHLVEGFIRIGMFLLYMVAISQMKDIKRVFRYHGAEHKTIMAWEHNENLDVALIQPYSTKHPRCGTNFLFLLMFLSIIIYTVAGVAVPAPSPAKWLSFGAYQVGLRVVLLPVVTGIAYEVLRLGASESLSWMAKPGIWLQYITTAEPDDDMVEVAIRSFQAVVPREELGDRIVDLPSAVVWSEDTSSEEGLITPEELGAKIPEENDAKRPEKADVEQREPDEEEVSK